MQKHDICKAIIATVIASAAIACMNCLTKLIQNNVSYEVVVFTRFLTASLIIFPFILFDKNLSLKTNCYHLHLLRSISGFLTVCLLIYSLKYLPVVESTLLFMTYPLFVPLLFFLIKKEKTSFPAFISIVVGFIGITIILDPHIDKINFYGLIGLSSGAMASVGIFCMRFLGKTEPARRTVFYFSSHATLFSFVILLFSAVTIPSKQNILVLLLIGLLGAIYQQGIAYALRFCHPNIVMSIFYVSIIFSGILDWIIWSQIPSSYSLLGYIVVILGAILTVRFGGLRSK